MTTTTAPAQSGRTILVRATIFGESVPWRIPADILEMARFHLERRARLLVRMHFVDLVLAPDGARAEVRIKGRPVGPVAIITPDDAEAVAVFAELAAAAAGGA